MKQSIMWYFFAKRVGDVAISLLGIVLLSPIFLIIALAIKLESPGPIFADTPERVGKGGRVFKMYKFRSMVQNAHKILRSDPKFKEVYEHYKRNSFKIKTDIDPRITKVGKILRKTSFDELPQLINILKGEMTLVGPRAFHADEIAQQQKRFPETKKLVEILLKAKPGLTGPWQVAGRSAIDFPDRVKLDATYAKQKSLTTDLEILLKTVPAIIRGEGN